MCGGETKRPRESVFLKASNVLSLFSLFLMFQRGKMVKLMILDNDTPITEPFVFCLQRLHCCLFLILSFWYCGSHYITSKNRHPCNLLYCSFSFEIPTFCFAYFQNSYFLFCLQVGCGFSIVWLAPVKENLLLFYDHKFHGFLAVLFVCMCVCASLHSLPWTFLWTFLFSEWGAEDKWVARTVAVFCHLMSSSVQIVERRMRTRELSIALLVEQVLILETSFALAVGNRLIMESLMCNWRYALGQLKMGLRVEMYWPCTSTFAQSVVQLYQRQPHILTLVKV